MRPGSLYTRGRPAGVASMDHPFLHTARRAAHLGRIALATGKLRWGDEARRTAARHALAGLIADGRGVPMKIGQFLATSSEGDPFHTLTTGVDPVPLEEIAGEIAQALGHPVAELFEEFDPNGIAASLGQVHRARHAVLGDLAVKVRYPGIREAVEAEMRLAQLIPGLGPVRTWGFDLDAYKRVLRDNLARELDYRNELERQARFRANLNVTGLVIPEVYPELSGETLLVQRWEGGETLDEVRSWPLEERRHVGVILMCTLFQSLFVHGEIHGDPHLGNYRFRRRVGATPEVVLLDFGCTVPIPREARLALVRLIDGAIARDDTDPLACFSAMGFAPEKLLHIRSILAALSEVLLEPFLTPTPFRLANWQLRQRVDVLLGELKWWFRAAGPANLLLLLRAFRGLVLQLETLDVALPWQSVFHRVVPPAVLQEARALELPSVPGGETVAFADMARYLKVEITEGGSRVVAITLPAGQTAVLETLMPAETLARIRESGIDLEGIKARACALGLQPQALFDFDHGARRYRVWLE